MDKKGKIALVTAFVLIGILLVALVVAAPKAKPACMDKLDNDGDGLIDFPDDPGCSSKKDNCESSIETYYQDLDSDAFGNPFVWQEACTQPSGYVIDNTDCDDLNGAVNPGAMEVCDSLDNNCNGYVDEGCPI